MVSGLPLTAFSGRAPRGLGSEGVVISMGQAYTGNHVMNPAQETLDNCEFFHDIDDTFRAVYEAMWMEVKNTK